MGSHDDVAMYSDCMLIALGPAVWNALTLYFYM